MYVTAIGRFGEFEFWDSPVLNAGERRGRTWLVEIAGPVQPIFIVVEAESDEEVVDVIADHEIFGGVVRCSSEGTTDTPNITVHGDNAFHQPYPVRYAGPGLPEPVLPVQLCEWDWKQRRQTTT